MQPPTDISDAVCRTLTNCSALNVSSYEAFWGNLGFKMDSNQTTQSNDQENHGIISWWPSSHRPKRACELAHEVEKCSALGSAFCTSLQYQRLELELKVFSVMVLIFCFVMVMIRLVPVVRGTVTVFRTLLAEKTRTGSLSTFAIKM